MTQEILDKAIDLKEGIRDFTDMRDLIKKETDTKEGYTIKIDNYEPEYADFERDKEFTKDFLHIIEEHIKRLKNEFEQL